MAAQDGGQIEELSTRITTHLSLRQTNEAAHEELSEPSTQAQEGVPTLVAVQELLDLVTRSGATGDPGDWDRTPASSLIRSPQA